MMRNLLYGSLLLLLWSCGGPATQEPASDNPAPRTNPYGLSDSVRQLYHSYLAKLENPMPLDCRPERGKVNPADAAPRDTVFFVFREHLKEVVAHKDIFGLLAHVDEQLKVSFGAEDGLRGFIQTWQLDSPDKVPDSPLWPQLADVLALGGQFGPEKNYFEAPYLNACYPDNAPLPAAEAQVVTGAGVRMRSGPGLQYQVLRTLSYDLLQHIERTAVEETIEGEVHPWIKVKTLDGVEGFVYGKFLRSPADLRAVFAPAENGRWRLVALLAGD